jgi:hypothetical protein
VEEGVLLWPVKGSFIVQDVVVGLAGFPAESEVVQTIASVGEMTGGRCHGQADHVEK